MPLPQVNDRLKEVPAQALRTLFATVGQLLLAADRLRARAAEQLSGSGEAPAAPPSRRPAPSQQAPAKAPPAKAPPAKAAEQPAQDAGTARWRSLDKTGNVRLLDGDEEDLDTTSASAGTAAPATSSQVPPVSAAPAAPPAPEPSVPEPVIPVPRGADAAPAGYTPTEPVPAVPAGPVKPAVPARPRPAPGARGGGAARTRRCGSPARSTSRARPARRRCRGGPPGPQLRPAFGGFAAGPVACAGCDPGARPARLREGTRGPPGRDHPVRAPSRQAERRQLTPAHPAARSRSHPPCRSTHPPTPRFRSAPSSG